MKPNVHLKHEREQRGWSQAKVADEIGTTEKNVSRWERGVSSPYPYFREKLCALFGKTAQELGFVKDDYQENPPLIDRERTISPPIYDPGIPPLPNEGRGLVGREELLDVLAEQMCTHKCVALSGLPGVGKTAIAATLVHHPRVRATFSDGILWAGLGSRPNVLEQLNRWGILLGLPVLETTTENGLEVRSIALRAAIGTRRLVLVVDDAWELEAVLPFKVGGPQCAFLVTTRFHRIALTITRDGFHTIPELSNEEGLSLLSQLAPSVVTHDKQAAQTFVQQVGGLPLALTLMGKYLNTQAHSGQPRRVQTALARLRDTTQRLLISEPQAPLERSPSLESGTPLSLLLHLGRVMYLQGVYNQAEVYLREGLTLAREGEYHEQTTQLLNFLNLVAIQRG